MRVRRELVLGLLLVIGLTGQAGLGAAAVTTERSASILVFPKVIFAELEDTIIQISNTSNSMVRAHCFYVNGALTDPGSAPGLLNPPLWQEIDFTITLTRQQPTQWRVGEGRVVDPTDPPCSPTNSGCDGAGFDPGRIPPVIPGFTGELKCVEVDDSGAPISGNHLLGLATLSILDPIAEKFGDETVFIAGLSKYNAIGIRGEENTGDDVLVLGGGQCGTGGAVCSSDEDCGDQGPCVPEYGACPQTWTLDHAADGAPNGALVGILDPAAAPPFILNELTVVPCTQNFETQIPTTVTLQFITTNEFESAFSVSTSVTCWGNFRLGDIGAPALTFAGEQPPDPQGTMYLHTRIRPAAGTPFGVFMVAEEILAARASNFMGAPFHNATIAAVNLHTEGDRPVPDLITIPADQLEP